MRCGIGPDCNSFDCGVGCGFPGGWPSPMRVGPRQKVGSGSPLLSGFPGPAPPLARPPGSRAVGSYLSAGSLCRANQCRAFPATEWAANGATFPQALLLHPGAVLRSLFSSPPRLHPHRSRKTPRASDRVGNFRRSIRRPSRSNGPHRTKSDRQCVPPACC